MKNSLLLIYRSALLAILMIAVPTVIYAQNPALGLNTIVIDPGHGGNDPGCISKDGKTQEKAVVLKISKKLKNRINKTYPSVKVLMTRDDDRFIPLNDRAKYASNNGASFFLSIHINASDRSTSANGYSVHLLGQSDNKNSNTYAYNMEVCKRENEVILLEEDYSTNYQGFDPKDPESDIFLKLMHNAYREQSLLFAQIVDNKLKNGPYRKSNGIYQNNFAVLRQASMPAMLLELGFMTNASDLAVIRSDEKIDQIVELLFQAFSEYKTLYDESTGATAPKAAGSKTQTAKPAVSKEQAPKEEQPKENAAMANIDGIVYGTQVLVTGKDMDKADKYFLGYEPICLKAGKYNKYIIGISADKAEAKKDLSKIRKTYGDAFLVKVENGVATLEK